MKKNKMKDSPPSVEEEKPDKETEYELRGKPAKWLPQTQRIETFLGKEQDDLV